MIKSIFVDYTGTLVREDGKEMQELADRLCGNSSLHDRQAMTAYFWDHVKRYERESVGDTYQTEDEIIERILRQCVREFDLRDDLTELHALFQASWIHAPAFEDVRTFFDRCPVPLWIVSNNGEAYVSASMEEKGLRPAGIICGDMARCYKPHPALFAKALEISGCRAEEVLHIGDSVQSDVEGALRAGILPILLDRTGGTARRKAGGWAVISALPEVFALPHVRFDRRGQEQTFC